MNRAHTQLQVNGRWVAMPVEERLWQWISKTDSCWLWTGALTPQGYGVISVNGKRKLAHRVVYELKVSKIPGGLSIDHKCEVKNCVNPAHLQIVTHQQNMQLHHNRRGSLLVCRNGHSREYTKLMYIKTRKSPMKICTVCRKVTNNSWTANNPEKRAFWRERRTSGQIIPLPTRVEIADSAA